MFGTCVYVSNGVIVVHSSHILKCYEIACLKNSQNNVKHTHTHLYHHLNCSMNVFHQYTICSYGTLRNTTSYASIYHVRRCMNEKKYSVHCSVNDGYLHEQHKSNSVFSFFFFNKQTTQQTIFLSFQSDFDRNFEQQLLFSIYIIITVVIFFSALFIFSHKVTYN